MKIIAISRKRLAFRITAYLFIACIIILFFNNIKLHSDKIANALVLDLLVSIPLIYFIGIYSTGIPKITIFRVFLIGVFISSFIISKNDLSFVKKYVAPICEAILIFYVIKRIYAAKKSNDKSDNEVFDFVFKCRKILFQILGNQKITNIIASEFAVFYYLFKSRKKQVDARRVFTTYKENGIMTFLATFLTLFILETIGLHFILIRYNKTIATVLSTLGIYSCLQLIAHMRALKSRPVLISDEGILVRSGLLGGDSFISFENLESVTISSKNSSSEACKIGFPTGLQNHNVQIQLTNPATIVKAFGIQRMSSELLLRIDDSDLFVKQLNLKISKQD